MVHVQYWELSASEQLKPAPDWISGTYVPNADTRPGKRNDALPMHAASELQCRIETAHKMMYSVKIHQNSTAGVTLAEFWATRYKGGADVELDSDELVPHDPAEGGVVIAPGPRPRKTPRKESGGSSGRARQSSAKSKQGGGGGKASKAKATSGGQKSGGGGTAGTGRKRKTAGANQGQGRHNGKSAVPSKPGKSRKKANAASSSSEHRFLVAKHNWGKARIEKPLKDGYLVTFPDDSDDPDQEYRLSKDDVDHVI